MTVDMIINCTNDINIRVTHGSDIINTIVVNRFCVEIDDEIIFWKHNNVSKDKPTEAWVDTVVKAFLNFQKGVEIMTIDVSEHDVEIRVTHDLDGIIGTLILNKDGVQIDDQFIAWGVGVHEVIGESI